MTEANTSQPANLAASIQIQDDAVVSRTIIKSDAGTVTLFGFDEGQALSEHTAPYDALVQVLDGDVLIRINQIEQRVKSGDFLIMPANEPHALTAITPVKMLLTMIKA